jgi:hypothetical protein
VLDHRSLLDKGLEANVGIERVENRLGRCEPAHDTRLLHEELRAADRVLIHGRLGRDVALPHVLGERRSDHPLERFPPK